MPNFTARLLHQPIIPRNGVRLQPSGELSVPAVGLPTFRFFASSTHCRLQRHSGRFCEHLVAGSKNLSEELLSPSRASKIPPASPAPLVMRLFAGLSCGRYLSPSSSAETALSTAAGDTDRVLTRRNRRFSGSFLHFNVFAVDAVGVLRTSPPTSCSPELMIDEAGTRMTLVPAPFSPAETWTRSME